MTDAQFALRTDPLTSFDPVLAHVPAIIAMLECRNGCAGRLEGNNKIMSVALPAEDLIESGTRDLRDGRETIAALVVAVGAPRLRRLGIELPAHLAEYPEHRLYALLAKDGSDSAHSRYNALIRKLVSYERSAECVSR